MLAVAPDQARLPSDRSAATPSPRARAGRPNSAPARLIGACRRRRIRRSRGAAGPSAVRRVPVGDPPRRSSPAGRTALLDVLDQPALLPVGVLRAAQRDQDVVGLELLRRRPRSPSGCCRGAAVPRASRADRAHVPQHRVESLVGDVPKPIDVVGEPRESAGQRGGDHVDLGRFVDDRAHGGGSSSTSATADVGDEQQPLRSPARCSFGGEFPEASISSGLPRARFSAPTALPAMGATVHPRRGRTPRVSRLHPRKVLRGKHHAHAPGRWTMPIATREAEIRLGGAARTRNRDADERQQRARPAGGDVGVADRAARRQDEPRGAHRGRPRQLLRDGARARARREQDTAGAPDGERRVHARRGGRRTRITTVQLTVRARVPGLEAAEFEHTVGLAADLCPVSNALRGNVEIGVRSELEAPTSDATDHASRRRSTVLACAIMPNARAHRLVIEPWAPFRLDLTVWALRRRAHNTVDRWDATGTYRRVCPSLTSRSRCR